MFQGQTRGEWCFDAWIVGLLYKIFLPLWPKSFQTTSTWWNICSHSESSKGWLWLSRVGALEAALGENLLCSEGSHTMPLGLHSPQTCLQKVSQGPWTNHSFTHHWVNHSCTTSPSESMAGKVNHPWGADVPKPKILSCPYPAYNDFNWRLCVCPQELTVCGGHRWLKLSLKLSLAK